LDTFLSPAVTAELIEMLFGMLTGVGPRNHGLDWSAGRSTFERESVPYGSIVVVSCAIMAERSWSCNTLTESVKDVDLVNILA